MIVWNMGIVSHVLSDHFIVPGGEGRFSIDCFPTHEALITEEKPSTETPGTEEKPSADEKTPTETENPSEGQSTGTGDGE